MIPVTAQAEPGDFDTKVRQRGRKFLASKPNPSSREFDPHSYWQSAKNDMHSAYQGLCAYTCWYMPSSYSIDHFLPKSQRPALAYEWNNYRLSSPRVNNHKADSMNIIDPFNVRAGWFVLDFPSCLVKAGENLPDLLTQQINETIRVLQLNDDDEFVQHRCDMMVDFAEGRVELGFVSKQCPFLASEIMRQGIQTTARDLFKRRTA